MWANPSRPQTLQFNYMSKEGSTQAPTRHPLKFRDPDFINPEKIDQEMRRVFDSCHGCRRWFNVMRDTVTDKIIKTYKMGDAKPEISNE